MLTGAIKKSMNFKLQTVVVFLIISFSFHNCKNRGYEVLDTPKPVIDNLKNNREYKLYIPDTKQKTPLLVYFHGVMSEGFKKIPTLRGYTGSPVDDTGLIEFCKLNKITLLVPKAKYTFEFLNCKSYGWSPFEKEIDGIEKIIDIVIKEFNINKKKVFLAGISGGAVLINHLANRRPALYNSILSHSQGYTTENKKLLKPLVSGPKFGVVLCYTGGDYKDLKDICNKTYDNYKKFNYRTIILKDLPPNNHSWDNSSNKRFWRLLKMIGQYSGTKK